MIIIPSFFSILFCLTVIYELSDLTILEKLSIVVWKSVKSIQVWKTYDTFEPTVDLDYEVYQGRFDAATGLNIYLGIRFAQDTSGSNRWQPPKWPLMNRTTIIPALSLPNRCPQGPPSLGNYSFDYEGDEDCLFLNVFSPANASDLPVYVWIHGGGYGVGQGRHDLTQLINGNNNSFIGVVIQYRLAAFGFLSSNEVARSGALNAGLLDQHFSLEWVQKYISRFGGDPRRVTISGPSAGGGSVVLQAMARGGTEGTKYFIQAAAQSPYLPFQHDYNASEPTQSYFEFAAAAGCFSENIRNETIDTTFKCLVSKSTCVLQAANDKVSRSRTHGTWAFLPVTDGKFLRDIPSRQLSQGHVNGIRSLNGNNANEGVPFVPGNITSEDEFIAYLQRILPFADQEMITEILRHHPISESVGPKYATIGIGPPGATALDVSQFAVGQQQRAYNLYSEIMFVCPSYWMAEAYTKSSSGGYKYQFSLPPSLHGSDQPVLNGPQPFYAGPDLHLAFQKIMGNFITTGDPSIDLTLANGVKSNFSTRPNPISHWPRFDAIHPNQINLNQTGGVLKFEDILPNVSVGYYSDPGLMNAIELVDANAWEGNRGSRCDFWRSILPVSFSTNISTYE